jgi:hypothetical protein
VLGEAGLDQEGEISYFVGNFVEKDGDGGGRANGWGSVERRGHGEAVCDVVGEIRTVIQNISPNFSRE